MNTCIFLKQAIGQRAFILAAAATCAMVSAGLVLPVQSAASHKAHAAVANPNFDAANSLAGKEKYVQALAKYKLAIAVQPTNGRIFHMYGRTFALIGQFEDAIEQYRLALGLGKGPNADLEYDLGVALAAHGENPEGAWHLKRATAINPKFVAAYSNLGVVLDKLEDYRASQEAFLVALHWQPTNAKLLARLKDINSKMSQTKHFDFASVEGVGAMSLTIPTTGSSNAGGKGLADSKAHLGRTKAAADTAPPVSVSKPASASSGVVPMDAAREGITTSLEVSLPSPASKQSTTRQVESGATKPADSNALNRVDSAPAVAPADTLNVPSATKVEAGATIVTTPVSPVVPATNSNAVDAIAPVVPPNTAP